MPGDREDEICEKALQLLAELCSVGAVENENCRDFIYYLRDRARPRLTDSGTAAAVGLQALAAFPVPWIPEDGEHPPESRGGRVLRGEACRGVRASGRGGGLPGVCGGICPGLAGGGCSSRLGCLPLRPKLPGLR